MSARPMGFLSYVRSDDGDGRVSELRERLSREVRLYSGEEFPIFQDRNDIRWGETWQQRIQESLDEATFLIPIVSPSFFRSPACREELTRFLAREAELNRTDLILPIYYVQCWEISEPARLPHPDELAEAIRLHQYADWRELRLEPFTNPEVGKRIAKMAEQILAARRRGPTAGAPAEAAGGGDGGQPPSGPKSDGKMSHNSIASQKPRPPSQRATWVVDAAGEGQCRTIGEALALAQAGDLVLVRPGCYREAVVVDKPVEIIGQGDVREIRVEADGGDALLLTTAMGRVANLTVRHTGAGEGYAVNIAAGRVEVTGCDISSEQMPGVAIHSGADPRLTRNLIHDCGESGVYVFLEGRGTIEDNDIFDNAHSGVAITSRGNPTLRRNRLHDGKQGGVHVHWGGLGQLVDNDIFSNAQSGVAVETDGRPVVRQNRIHWNRNWGLWIQRGGGGTFEGNDLRHNAEGPCLVGEGCDPGLTLADNQE